MPRIFTYIFIWLSVVCMLSCGRGGVAAESEPLYEPRYASGFEIVAMGDTCNSLIITRNPWQGAGGSETRLFISRDGSKPPKNFEGQTLYGNAERIVCMSSSHVALLDAVGAVESVVGVSGINFICNDYIVRHRDSIADIGYDGNIDYETLVGLEPDLVMLYGVTGASPMEPKLRELGIPYMYVGEYLEEAPLGKAEWIVVVGEVVGRRTAAIAEFETKPAAYERIRQQVREAALPAPKVMINAPYGDSWFMASTESYVALLIADAGGDYIYTKNRSDKALPIDAEEALLLVLEADIWLNVNNIGSLDELRSRLPKFADARCVRSGAVYNCDRRLNEFGGNDYWESAVVHPDAVLRDLVKIMHPQLVSEDFEYYRKLPQTN